jgi:hypothetical protein
MQGVKKVPEKLISIVLLKKCLSIYLTLEIESFELYIVS